VRGKKRAREKPGEQQLIKRIILGWTQRNVWLQQRKTPQTKACRRKTARTREENHARSISAPLSDEEENFIQETPEAALVAAQAYLLTMQPEPRISAGTYAPSSH
jgi:hypothetical protein